MDVDGGAPLVVAFGVAVFKGFSVTGGAILLNLEKVSLESCILLVILTYYIKKKETFKAKVN